MTDSNYNRQMLKRQRITSSTLIIGIDIGCDSNRLCMMNRAGEVLGEHIVYNSRQGFDFFKSLVDKTARKYRLWDVFVGFEPTGCYWRKIGYYAKELGYEVRFVRTTALKHQRGLDESAPGKTDKRDAYTIANIVREGKYIDSVIDDGVYRELRSLVSAREYVVRSNVKAKNAIRNFLEDYFPELSRLYSSVSCKGSIAILEECPFPEDILSYGRKRLAGLLTRSSRSKKIGESKAHKIYAAARESVGLKNLGDTDRHRLEIYLKDLKTTEEHLQRLRMDMEDLLEKIPFSEYMLSIPGVGILSAGIFLGELGNPDNFMGAKQVVKFAGYDPVGHDSGKYKSRRRISKKGRWKLRKVLHFMSMRVVRMIPEYKEYYQNKIKGMGGSARKLTRKEALCAVSIKLIKMIFALLRDRRMYEERKTSLPLAA
jgi:transposase